ncbi:MAG TPA: HAMP domain-containing sensor histidine kinase, partial [Chitinophagaceae bacterium]|nr:HAMP domain-containing sensor histidine kinase [Chitinophagaceae bacterium]
DIISFYEVGADMQKNVFVNQVPEHMALYTDASLLSLVVRNLADNANKYTAGGEIKIEAMQDLSATRVIITDTGVSMDRELVARLLDKTYSPREPGRGWGYKIILEVLAKLGGTLAIEAGSGGGNKITITFGKDMFTQTQ